MASEPSSSLGAVRAALRDTGALGATILQLASHLDAPPGRVEEELDRLERDGEVARFGRGFWMLRDFERLEERDDFAEPATFVERFSREDGISLGRYDGPITFRSNDTSAVHRWWPYVQGYSAEFVRGVLDRAELARGATVLDPFAGSGTTLVEARRNGHGATGIELLPPAALAARVKTRFELDPDRLGGGLERWVRSARSRRVSTLPFLRETRRQFEPGALRELLRLRADLPPDGSAVGEALRLAFGRILIPSSRLVRSPCLGYRRRADPDGRSPTDRLREAVGWMRADLAELRGERTRWGPATRVLQRDARTVSLPPGGTDLAVTSPPYVNGMDYVMNYKVDLAWLGYAGSYADLRAFRSASVACDNLPRRETAPYVDRARPPDRWLNELLPRIEENLRRKATYRRDDMHAVVFRYFDDLAKVLRRVFDALKPGGKLVLVVGDSLLAGVYVPGDLLTARIGASLGFRIESVRVARTRRSGQRRSFGLRESVVVLQRPPS